MQQRPLLPSVSYIPEVYLPPADRVTSSQVDYSEAICRNSRFLSENPGNADFILEIIRLLLPYGEILGASQTIKEIPASCYLANLLLSGSRSEGISKIIDAVAISMLSCEILDKFPVAKETPTRKTNILLFTFLRLQNAPILPYIATDLQIGLLRALSQANYQRSDLSIKSLGALISGPLRVFSSISELDIKSAYQSDDPRMFLRLLLDTIDGLSRLRGPIDQNHLKPGTCKTILRDCLVILGKSDLLGYASEIGPLGMSASNQDDDLDENEIDPRFCQAVQITKRNLEPGSFLEPDSWVRDNEYTHLSSERSIMQEYVSPLQWDAIPIDIVADIVSIILQSNKDINPERFAARVLLLSILFIGRPASFFQGIRIGKFPEPGETIVTPLYIPDSHCIIFPADAFRNDYPLSPRQEPNMYLPIANYWVISLPEPLRILWDRLNQITRSSFLFEIISDPRQVFSQVTQWIRKSVPHLPPVSESRLQITCKVLHQCMGDMDPLLSNFISGQWRNSDYVPFIYTTISCSWLGKRYLAAFNKIWNVLSQYRSNLPDISSNDFLLVDDLYIGSPYRPIEDYIQQIISRLQKRLHSSNNDEDIHNSRTMLTLFLLGFVTGLRRMEVWSLRARQVDLDNCYKGKPLPWIALDKSKTNRWTTASRIVPLPSQIVRLMKPVLSPSLDTPAFYFLEKGRKLFLTEATFAERYRRLQTNLKWHSGRHLVRSWLCEQGVEDDNINALLGHQSGGRELLNPHLPNDPWRVWSELADYLHGLASVLGVEEE